jgi:N-acetyltransferase 10
VFYLGFEVLQYQEHIDYDLVQSTDPEFNKAIVRINFFRDHRQTIQVVEISDSDSLFCSEILNVYNI